MSCPCRLPRPPRTPSPAPIAGTTPSPSDLSQSSPLTLRPRPTSHFQSPHTPQRLQGSLSPYIFTPSPVRAPRNPNVLPPLLPQLPNSYSQALPPQTRQAPPKPVKQQSWTPLSPASVTSAQETDLEVQETALILMQMHYDDMAFGAARRAEESMQTQEGQTQRNLEDGLRQDGKADDDSDIESDTTIRAGWADDEATDDGNTTASEQSEEDTRERG